MLMRNTILLLAFLFTSSFLIAQETPMSASEISVFKEKVSAVAGKTETIKSDFVQYKHLDFLTSDVKTSGKMMFKAPDLVRWEYTDPYQYSVVFNENQLLINDGGTKSKVDIGNSKLFRKLNELIVNSVKGRSEEHTSELQSRPHLVCRLLLEKKKTKDHAIRR